MLLVFIGLDRKYLIHFQVDVLAVMIFHQLEPSKINEHPIVDLKLQYLILYPQVHANTLQDLRYQRIHQTEMMD